MKLRYCLDPKNGGDGGGHDDDDDNNDVDMCLATFLKVL